MEKNGGKISYRSNNTDTPEPYEINITLFDAMRESFKKDVTHQFQRFMCIHTIMLSLEGVLPSMYIVFLAHRMTMIYMNELIIIDLLIGGAFNCLKLVYLISLILKHLFSVNLKKLIHIRKKQLAFHPNAVQFTLHLGSSLYGIWRQSLDKKNKASSVSPI